VFKGNVDSLKQVAETAELANGCEAVCIFVNDKADAPCLEVLARGGVKYLLLRSAGFNHVDLKVAANWASLCGASRRTPPTRWPRWPSHSCWAWYVNSVYWKHACMIYFTVRARARESKRNGIHVHTLLTSKQQSFSIQRYQRYPGCTQRYPKSNKNRFARSPKPTTVCASTTFPSTDWRALTSVARPLALWALAKSAPSPPKFSPASPRRASLATMSSKGLLSLYICL